MNLSVNYCDKRPFAPPSIELLSAEKQRVTRSGHSFWIQAGKVSVSPDFPADFSHRSVENKACHTVHPFLLRPMRHLVPHTVLFDHSALYPIDDRATESQKEKHLIKQGKAYAPHSLISEEKMDFLTGLNHLIQIGRERLPYDNRMSRVTLHHSLHPSEVRTFKQDPMKDLSEKTSCVWTVVPGETGISLSIRKSEDCSETPIIFHLKLIDMKGNSRG